MPLPGEVHLWRVPLDVPDSQIAANRGSLSQDEITRAGNYVFERDRSSFVVGRGALRNILAGYLGCRPGDVRFEYGQHGKPRVCAIDPARWLQFNFSHSKDIGICAVTRDRAIGVDIEWMRTGIDVTGIARSTFSADECERLEALPPTSRLEAFYACWTRKEAYIKARGEGLNYPLDAFDVSLEPGAPAALRWSREGSIEVDRWALCALEVEAGYAGALAVEGTLQRLSIVN